MLGFSLGDDFRIVSVFSAELGSTVDTCWLQSMRLREEFHTFFYVKVDSDPEVLQRARWYADTALWARIALSLSVV